MAVDERDRIRGVLDDVDRAVPRGLVTLERARLATGADVAGADFPAGPGNGRQAHDLLRDRRAPPGPPRVPRGGGGAAAGRRERGDRAPRRRRQPSTGRRRARLFSANGDTPMVIISVGPAEPLRRSLPHLAAVLAEPVVTLEPIAQVKHDGELLEPPLASAARRRPEPWQTIRIYARRTARSTAGRSTAS